MSVTSSPQATFTPPTLYARSGKPRPKSLSTQLVLSRDALDDMRQRQERKENLIEVAAGSSPRMTLPARPASVASPRASMAPVPSSPLTPKGSAAQPRRFTTSMHPRESPKSKHCQPPPELVQRQTTTVSSPAKSLPTMLSKTVKSAPVVAVPKKVAVRPVPQGTEISSQPQEVKPRIPLQTSPTKRPTRVVTQSLLSRQPVAGVKRKAVSVTSNATVAGQQSPAKVPRLDGAHPQAPAQKFIVAEHKEKAKELQDLMKTENQAAKPSTLPQTSLPTSKTSSYFICLIITLVLLDDPYFFG